MDEAWKTQLDQLGLRLAFSFLYTDHRTCQCLVVSKLPEPTRSGECLGTEPRPWPQRRALETGRAITPALEGKGEDPCLLYTSPSPRDAHES
eukprot:7390461-Prymnesium_polylepis.1